MKWQWGPFLYIYMYILHYHPPKGLSPLFCNTEYTINIIYAYSHYTILIFNYASRDTVPCPLNLYCNYCMFEFLMHFLTLPSKKFFSPCNRFAETTFSQLFPGQVFHILYPRKWGSRSGGTFYIPEWMTPNTSHNNKGKLCYDIPGEKPHYIYQYMACLGESWVNHEFALFFFTRGRYFHKNPRISDIFPVQ